MIINPQLGSPDFVLALCDVWLLSPLTLRSPVLQPCLTLLSVQQAKIPDEQANAAKQRFKHHVVTAHNWESPCAARHGRAWAAHWHWRRTNTYLCTMRWSSERGQDRQGLDQFPTEMACPERRRGDGEACRAAGSRKPASGLISSSWSLRRSSLAVSSSCLIFLTWLWTGISSWSCSTFWTLSTHLGPPSSSVSNMLSPRPLPLLYLQVPSPWSHMLTVTACKYIYIYTHARRARGRLDRENKYNAKGRENKVRSREALCGEMTFFLVGMD